MSYKNPFELPPRPEAPGRRPVGEQSGQSNRRPTMLDPEQLQFVILLVKDAADEMRDASPEDLDDPDQTQEDIDRELEFRTAIVDKLEAFQKAWTCKRFHEDES